MSAPAGRAAAWSGASGPVAASTRGAALSRDCGSSRDAAPSEGAPSADSLVHVEHVMGMPVSIHLRGPGATRPEAVAAVEALVADLHEVDARFSTYRPDSELSRLQRGELRLEDCHRDLRDVHLLCRAALERTGGAFDAWAADPAHPGVFDPTGLVKSWAVSRALRRLDGVADLAVAVGAGGDVVVRPGARRRVWQVGIEDAADRRRVLARVPLTDGAVATSGLAARGTHIVDPRTGTPATAVLSATVIGPSLLWADVLATAAVALGTDAPRWARGLDGTSGLLVLADGSTHRWGPG